MLIMLPHSCHMEWQKGLRVWWWHGHSGAIDVALSSLSLSLLFGGGGVPNAIAAWWHHCCHHSICKTLKYCIGLYSKLQYVTVVTVLQIGPPLYSLVTVWYSHSTQ